jgi:hypothetical protein
MLRKQLEYLESTNKKVLLSDFIGKLAIRMPDSIINGKWDDFQIEEIKRITAALLVNILIDSEEYELVTEVIKLSPEHNSDKPFSTALYLVFSGDIRVKELLKGLEVTPGVCNQTRIGNIKLANKFKELLAKVSSMPFKLSDVATKELLIKGYSLSKDYNSTGKNGGEVRAAKKVRYRGYADIIVDNIGHKDKFYLPMKYDSRGRMYYEFQLNGMRPQGQLWETLMIDAAEPKLLCKAALGHLQHIIITVRYGKCSVADAVNRFSSEDLKWAKELEPMDVKTPVKSDYYLEGVSDKEAEESFGNACSKAQNEFGEILLVNKAVYAIHCWAEVIPCPYLFGKDLTNSGLMMAGANFKSSKMLKASNLSNSTEVHDSYMDMQEAYGLEHLTRKDMKKICTPMLHGASLNSLVKNVQSALAENGQNEHTTHTIDLDFVKAKNIEAFGQEVNNIFAISAWGAEAVNNYQTKLYWTTVDGFKAFHKAHIKHCPVTIYAATSSTKAGYRRYDLIANMPFKQQANGHSLFDKGTVAKGSNKPIEVSKAGLYANLTHSFDATLIRKVIANVIDKGEVCLLKHDDYMVFPDNYDSIIDTAVEFFKGATEQNMYKLAIDQIAQKATNTPTKPYLFVGEGTVDTPINFLMP